MFLLIMKAAIKAQSSDGTAATYLIYSLILESANKLAVASRVADFALEMWFFGTSRGEQEF